MKQTQTPNNSLHQPQQGLLEILADGGIIAVVHTRGGTIASVFPREGRHRNISYKAVQPMMDAGWIEDVVPKPLRWRGSKYIISAKGRRVLGSRVESNAGDRELAHSQIGIR